MNECKVKTFPFEKDQVSRGRHLTVLDTKFVLVFLGTNFRNFVLKNQFYRVGQNFWTNGTTETNRKNCVSCLESYLPTDKLSLVKKRNFLFTFQLSKNFRSFTWILRGKIFSKSTIKDRMKVSVVKERKFLLYLPSFHVFLLLMYFG